MTDQGAPPPPGWYPDPQNPYLQRWWNGSAWTEHAAVLQSVPATGAFREVTVRDDDGSARKNSAAVWGFVVSLASIPAWMFGPFLAILLAVVGIVLGGVGLAHAKSRGRGFGFALAAVIIGAFQAFGGVLILMLMSTLGSGSAGL